LEKYSNRGSEAMEAADAVMQEEISKATAEHQATVANREAQKLKRHEEAKAAMEASTAARAEEEAAYEDPVDLGHWLMDGRMEQMRSVRQGLDDAGTSSVNASLAQAMQAAVMATRWRTKVEATKQRRALLASSLDAHETEEAPEELASYIYKAISRAAATSTLETETLETKSGSQLHVRGVGVNGWDGSEQGVGIDENEGALQKIFSSFGSVLNVAIHHRIQMKPVPLAPEGTPYQLQNTSWALITMQDSASVDRALSQAEQAGVIDSAGNRLVVTRFSEKQDQGSKGGTRQIRSEELRITHTYEQGELIEVYEVAKTKVGRVRVRTKHGWVSVVSSRGKELLQLTEDLEVQRKRVAGRECVDICQFATTYTVLCTIAVDCIDHLPACDT
jgi:hypothetical protein